MREIDKLAADTFSSTRCHCGKPKRERQPFCWSCWNALEDYPARLKLPHQVGREYTENYFAAIEFLKTRRGRQIQ